MGSPLLRPLLSGRDGPRHDCAYAQPPAGSDRRSVQHLAQGVFLEAEHDKESAKYLLHRNPGAYTHTWMPSWKPLGNAS